MYVPMIFGVFASICEWRQIILSHDDNQTKIVTTAIIILTLHTCDNFMMTMREICFSDEGDWSLNEGDFLMTCSSSFSYQFHMV